jgi:hypothetical protein
MAKCECLPGCPFFNGQMAQSLSAIAELMKKRYCLGDPNRCARFMVKERLGKPHVPKDLIPNQVWRAHKIISEAA